MENIVLQERKQIMDKELKVRQLLVTLNEYPYIKFEVRIKEIELWSNEFHYYDDKEEIHIERDGLIYFIELFFPIETSYQDILEIEKKAKEKMIEYFENKISHFQKLKGAIR